MSVVNSIAVGLPIALGVVMIGAGGVNFAGPASVRASTLGLSGRLSQGDGGARSRGGFASADPGNLTGWSDWKRRHPAGRSNDADSLSRLGSPAGRRGPDGRRRGGDSDPTLFGPHEKSGALHPSRSPSFGSLRRCCSCSMACRSCCCFQPLLRTERRDLGRSDTVCPRHLHIFPMFGV